MARFVIPQVLHERIASPAKLKGTFAFMEQMAGPNKALHSAAGDAARISIPLRAQRSWKTKRREVKSQALAEIRPGDWEREIKSAAGIKVTEIPAGSGPLYYQKENSLGLDRDGGLALAIMTHYMPEICRSARPALLSLLEGKEMPDTGPAEFGAALFMLHLANHGIDGMFEDIFLERGYALKLEKAKGHKFAEDTLAEMRIIQFNYLSYVYDGSRANII